MDAADFDPYGDEPPPNAGIKDSPQKPPHGASGSPAGGAGRSPAAQLGGAASVSPAGARPPPSTTEQLAAVLDNVEIYIYGSGADFKRKTTGRLAVVEGQLTVRPDGDSRSLPLGQFALLACNRFRKPSQCIKVALTGETLAAFETRNGLVRDDAADRAAALAGPASLLAQDLIEDSRNDAADYERQRLLQKQYQRERRREDRERERRSNPEKIEAISYNRALPGGAWTQHRTEGGDPGGGGGQGKGRRSEGGAGGDAQSIYRAHKTWRQNTPLLYEMVMVQPLDSSSLTVQWLPEISMVVTDVVMPGGKDIIAGGLLEEHRMLLGTYTGYDEGPSVRRRDYVMVGALLIPKDLGEEPDQDIIKATKIAAACVQLDIVVRAPHQGEVNKARYMPGRSSCVATLAGGGGGEAYIFDMGRHVAHPKVDDGVGKHDVMLKGHSKEGYGLSWSSRAAGMLLSGCHDHLVCVWDVNANQREDAETRAPYIVPKCTLDSGHTDAVADVAWHPHHADVCGSVGDDKLLCLWDVRCSQKPTQSVVASEWGINSLSFNHINDHVLATASGRAGAGVVSVWDTRKMGVPKRVLETHTDVVEQVEFAAHSEHILSSTSQDRRVHVLDLSRDSRSDRPDDPSELVFVHGGHTAKVSDMSWNEHKPWLCASLSEHEKTLQVWHMNRQLIPDEEEDTASVASSYDSDALEEVLTGRPIPRIQSPAKNPSSAKMQSPAKRQALGAEMGWEGGGRGGQLMGEVHKVASVAASGGGGEGGGEAGGGGGDAEMGKGEVEGAGAEGGASEEGASEGDESGPGNKRKALTRRLMEEGPGGGERGAGEEQANMMSEDDDAGEKDGDVDVGLQAVDGKEAEEDDGKIEQPVEDDDENRDVEEVEDEDEEGKEKEGEAEKEEVDEEEGHEMGDEEKEQEEAGENEEDFQKHEEGEKVQEEEGRAKEEEEKEAVADEEEKEEEVMTFVPS